MIYPLPKLWLGSVYDGRGDSLDDVAFEAKLQKNRLGILDQNKQLLTEIVGL